MKNYKIYKNFITEKECNILSKWIVDNKDQSFFLNNITASLRVSTRFSDNFNFPQEAYRIKEKIINKLIIKNFYLPDYKDGMVASYAMPGDTCYNHKDPVWKKNTITLHCNIKLSDSTGGNPIVEDKKLNLKKRDMWIYPVSDVIHGSDLVTGTIPRTMWVFGFCITQKDYDRLF